VNCSRKLTFATVEQAERTASIVAGIRLGQGKVPVRIYECARCGLLHFTSKSEAATRAKATTVAGLDIRPWPPAARPAAQPPAPAKAPPPPVKPKRPVDPLTAQRERFERLLEQSAKARRRYEAQTAWLKQQAREAARMLITHGSGAVDDAIVLLDAAAGFPNMGDPASPEVMRHVARRMAEKREWLRSRNTTEAA
jgi:type IV secretory pathway VirB10-like protein